MRILPAYAPIENARTISAATVLIVNEGKDALFGPSENGHGGKLPLETAAASFLIFHGVIS